MIAGLVIILSMTAAGLPLTALLAPSRPPRSFLALSYLLGSAFCALVLFAFSLIGVRWSAAALAVGALVPIAISAPWALRRMRTRPAAVRLQNANLAPRLVDLLTLVSICGYAIYATIAPMWEWDFWSLWGMAGRVFYEHRGIDWEFLSRPENFLFHYSGGGIAFRPILHPLMLDAFSILRGTWDDRFVGLLFAGFAAALLLLVRDELERETESPLLAAVAVLTITGVAASRWVGNPEGLITAYMTVAVLLTRRALRSDDATLLSTGAIFAGLAALTKDEGATFVVALIAGVAVVTRRNWRMLLAAWPAVALLLPWLFLRHSHGLSDRSAIKPLLERVSTHLSNPGELLSALAQNLPDRPIFWIAVALTLLVFLPRALRQESFAVTTLALQLCFYVGAYLTTPFDVQWHVATSWVRLLYQLAPSLMFVAVVVAWPAAQGGKSS